MSELTVDAAKLSKLGRTLAGLSDAIALIENLEDRKVALNKEVTAAQAGLAALKGDQVKATDAIGLARKQAEAIVQTAHDKAASVAVKADEDAQSILKQANADKNKISADAEKLSVEVAELKKAKSAADAATTAAKAIESDIMARIAKLKEDAKRSLGV